MKHPRKTAAVLLTVGLLLGSLASPPSAQAAERVTYADLQGHFAAGAVQRLIDLGVIAANKSMYFNPDQAITRTQFNEWQKKALGSDTTPQTKGELIPRWEAALLVDKARVGLMGGNEAADARMFLDSYEIPQLAQVAVGRLYMRGIVVGEGYGMYKPHWNLTRGEAAVMLNAMLDVTGAALVDYTVVSDESKLPADVRQAIEANKNTPGVHSLPMHQSRYLLVSLGTSAANNRSVKVHGLVQTHGAYFLQASAITVQPGAGKPYAVVAMLPALGKVYLQEQAPQLHLDPHDEVTMRLDGVDLDRDGVASETVALVKSIDDPVRNHTFDTGYLKVFQPSGYLNMSIKLRLEEVLDPKQLLVTDLTGDGVNDIFFESDVHGNGGMGSHVVGAFEQVGIGSFGYLPIETPDGSNFRAPTYDASAKQWNVSAQDGRKWSVRLVGPQWNGFDAAALPKPFAVNVDNPYTATVTGGKLTTRHYAWTGAHPMGLFHLVPTYRYTSGKLVVETYRTEQVEGTVLQEK